LSGVAVNPTDQVPALVMNVIASIMNIASDVQARFKTLEKTLLAINTWA
jgi:hypothetical protein